MSGISPKLNIDDCHMAAKKRGGKCLEKVYLNNHTKMLWKCSNEAHPPFYMPLRNVRNNHWCPICGGKVKYNIDSCHISAELRGGQCLEDEYSGIGHSMRWVCNEGHAFNMSYDNICAGHWCPHCAGVFPYTIEDCHSLAKSKGGVCLDTKYVNVYTKMRWQCKNNHIFSKPLSSIVSGRWCRSCANDDQRLGIDACHLLAANNKGKCLEKVYLNNRTKMLWKCEKGHKFFKSYTQAKHNWCSICHSSSKQKLLTNIIKEVFPNNIIEVNYKGFSWLMNPKTRKRLELDIFLPEIKLAIEYDGEYHFLPVRFNGMSETKAKDLLKNIKKLDSLKNDLISKHPKIIKKFIRFNYKEKIDKCYVLKKLGGSRVYGDYFNWRRWKKD